MKTTSELKRIQMTDLTSQYQRIKSEIDLAISDVLSQGDYINGRAVKLFSEELSAYLGVKHVIPCGNGTDALQIALMALDLPPGSEVITPAFSYAAVTEVCHLMGLKPVFADVDLLTYNVDLESVESLINDKTRAIVPVHLFGQACDMGRLYKLARKHKLYLIEDNAQSFGATMPFEGGTRKTGTVGHMSTMSFFPSKNLGCYGDGGAICTDDDALAEKLRMIANHGQKKKYQHEVIGINSRLDTLQAAVLRVKLKHLEGFISERQSVAARYDEAFSSLEGVRIPHVAKDYKHVYHQYTLLLDEDIDRQLLMKSLTDSGIPSMVYYPAPLYRQVAYRQEVYLRNSELLSGRVLSLPIGTDMENEQIEHIIFNIIETIRHK